MTRVHKATVKVVLIRTFQVMLGMILLSRKDLTFRRWNRPEAERRVLAAQKRANAEYAARRSVLANFIVYVVEQQHVNGHLHAPSISTLLLALKEEVDQSGGFRVRQPSALGASTEGQREQFMRDAFEVARKRGDIAIYADPEQPFYWLYAKHTAPKWIVHRNGRTFPDYIPTQEELAVSNQETDTSPALLVTDHQRSKMRSWGEPTGLIA